MLTLRFSIICACQKMGCCENSLRSNIRNPDPIFCQAQITSSQTGVSQKQKQRPTTASRERKPVGTGCFVVAVAVAFDFNAIPLLTLPIVRDRKWIKKVLLSERSEFQHFPIFCLAQLGTRRAVAAWSPFFASFLWRSKERKWLSGHTRPQNDV